jgi:tape measure domain-containing protein
MQEDLGLNLKINVDTKALEKEIKALSKKLALDLTLDLKKASDSLDKFKTSSEKTKVALPVDLDLKSANASLKAFKTSLKGLETVVSVGLDIASANSKLLEFNKKLSGAKTKQPEIEIEIDTESVEVALGLLKTQLSSIEGKTTLSKFDIDIDAAKFALDILKENVDDISDKSSQIEFEFDDESAKLALEILEGNVSKIEAKLAGLNINIDGAAANYALDILDDSVKTAKTSLDALNEKLQDSKKTTELELTLDTKKADSAFDKFVKTVEGQKLVSKLSLDDSDAKAVLKAVKDDSKNQNSLANLDLDVKKADKTFDSFAKKVEGKTLSSKFDLNISTANTALKALQTRAKNQKNSTGLSLNVVKADFSLDAFVKKVKSKSNITNLDLSVKKAETVFNKFVKKVQDKQLVSKFNIDTKASDAKLKQIINATKSQKTTTTLELDKSKFDTSFNNLVKKVENNTTTTELDLDTKKADKTFDKFVKTVEDRTIISKFNLDAAQAKADLKFIKDTSKDQKNITSLILDVRNADKKFERFVNQVENLQIVSNLDLKLKTAIKTLDQFRKTVETNPIFLPFKIRQSSLKELIKDLNLEIDLNLTKVKATLKKLKEKLQAFVFKSDFDLNLKRANDKIKLLRETLKATPLVINADTSLAESSLRRFQNRVERSTVFANVGVLPSQQVPTTRPVTPSQPSVAPTVRPTTPLTRPNVSQNASEGVEQVNRTIEATQRATGRLNGLQGLLNNQIEKAKQLASQFSNIVDEDTLKQQTRLAKQSVKNYEAQALAAQRFAESVKKAQTILGKQTADLEVGKIKIKQLERQLQVTRELAAQGLRTSEDVQKQQALLTQRRERVNLMEQEVNRLQTLANSQDVATSRIDRANQSLATARRNYSELRTESENVSRANNNLLNGFAKFSIIDNLVDRAVDALLELPGAIIRATVEIERLQAKLDFSTAGKGKEKLEQIFKTAQRLGISFKEASDGYALFAASVKGTELEIDTDKIFNSVIKASAALKLSAEQTQGTFTALSQMASKGVISMEEWRQQLAERLPIASSIGVKALQAMVDKGTIAVTSINKNLLFASREVRDNYQVTMLDFSNLISSGLLQAKDLLPEVANELNKVTKNLDVEGLPQSIERAKNSLLLLGADIGQNLSPILVSILDKFVEIADFVTQKTNEIFGLFKPFLVLGDIVLEALGGIDTALKSFFSAGFIELLLSSLDEIGIALLAVFGGPLIAMISSAIVAAKPFIAGFAAILAAVFAIKFALQGLIKLVDYLTGGAITNALEWFGDKFKQLKKYIDNVNKELNETKTYIDAIKSELLKGVGTEAGSALSNLSFNKFTDALLNIKQELQGLDVIEATKIAEIEQNLADNLISDANATQEKLASSIENNQERLRLAIQEYELATAILDTDITGKAADDAIETRANALKNIGTLKSDIAKATIEMRKAAIQADVEELKKGSDRLQRETTRAELQRIEAIRKLSQNGNVNLKEIEDQRIAFTEKRIDDEIKLEQQKIEKLKEIAAQTVQGSSEENDLLNQIVEAEKRQSELISQKADLELERQKILENQVEIQATKLENEKAELEIQAEILSIANDLKIAQNDLIQAQTEAAQSRLNLEQTYAQLELDRLNSNIEAGKLLIGLEQDRKNEVASRLGIEASSNAIEMLRERKLQEDEIYQIKMDQMLLQQQSEREQLEFQRTQIKFEAEQEKFRLNAAKLEAKISKLKADQAVSSAMAARSAALQKGDTEAASQAELEILQARQQSELANKQLELISKQNSALGRQTQIQNKIIDSQIESLNVQHEQQQVELELESITEARSSALEIETKLIEEQAQSRELSRRDALLALEYGTDAQKQASATLKLQLELNNIQAEYIRQSEYVADLEASGILNSEEELILTEAKNDLSEIGLSFLETEYQLEEALANEIAQERENALQRQNEILKNRKTLLEAELGLQQAQNDLENVRLERRLLEIDRKEGLGRLDPEQADEARFKIERQQLELEQEMLIKQQESDLKRLEIEQQIEIMRLRATQAEAEVVRARAEATLAESKGALSRAVESGDQDAIDAAEGAIEASEKGVEAATDQIELLDDQIEQTLELQKIQLETIETQQKADQERLNNRERELEIAREIAEYEERQARQAAEDAEWEAGFDNTGNRVSGGGVSAGSTYIVGEQGTELFQGVDGSARLLGVKGQHAFTPNVPGKILSNQTLEQVIAANVMRSDEAVVNAIQRGFKTSQSAFSTLAGVLANRTNKPVVVNNYGSENTPSIDLNRLKLSRL